MAHVALDRNTIRVDGNNKQLQAGMDVIAEIKIGKRRLISFLLAPLAEHIDTAGSER